MRWIGAVALVAAMSMTLLLPAAWASQGGRYTGSGYNGVRANISGSSSVPSTGGVIATVRVQSAMSGDPGLFQVGHIKSGSSFTSDCGTGTIGIMVERRNPGGQYFCDAFFGVFGTNYRFGAVRASGTSGDWKAYQDGTQIGPTRTLSFGSGNAIAVGEYNGTAPSSYSFTWGPSGSTAWQVSTNSGTSYSTVTSASSFNDGGWSVGSPPSPFTISR